MAKIVHQIWEDTNDDGDVLPGVCLAGPDGDGFRELLHPNARCVGRFEANSHFEAMTIFYRHFDRGEYTTDHVWDRQPYPDDWARRQLLGTSAD